MRHWLRTSGWKLLPGLLAASVALITDRAGLWQSFEHNAYRALFHIRGEQPWNDQVTVIEIDQASLDKVGTFPWPRYYYTDLLNQLIPAEPSVIAFDILFAEPQAEDKDFAKAMASHGNVVVATAWDPQGSVIGPNANVMQGAIATGHIHNQADPDGITRFYQSKVNGTLALSITAVQRHHKKPLSRLLPHSAHQPLWLNWRGKSHTSPRYSFIDVLSGEIPADIFTNKIVFIGYTGQALDTMTTPYNQTLPTAGVYQHIVAANNILAQNHLKKMTMPVWMALILMSSGFGYSLFNRRLSSQIFASLIVTSGWSAMVIVAFNHDYWLPIVIPVAAITTTAHFVKFTEHMVKGKNKLLSATEAS